MDGWCLPIIFKEVLSFYETEITGKTCDLPTPPPYRDYIAWLNSQDKEAATEFWRQTLDGFIAPTPLRVNKTPYQNQQPESNYSEVELRLSTEVSGELQSIAKQHHVTLSTIVQAVWALLLSRYSGETDVVFGVTVSGRSGSLSGMENIVGLLINTLPLRLQISPQAQLIAWLQQIQQLMSELQHYSYTPLVEIQTLSEVPGGIPLFETIVVMENYPVDSSLMNEDSSLQISKIETFEQTNFPVTVIVIPGDELLVKISYDTARFEETTMGRMLGHLQTIFSAIVENPSTTVGELPLLSAAERHQLLVDWNHTVRAYSREKCIHQLFESQVERTPNAVAVVWENQQLTYLELNQRANQLANYLKSLGVKPELLVGICIERSLEMIVGLLGILKAGGAYVPLDPNYPPERLAEMLNDSQASILLTQQKLRQKLSDYTGLLIDLDSQWQVISQDGEQNIVSEVQADNLAYVIYTSGSTGKPKGVMISHRSLVNAYWGWEEAYQLSTHTSSHLQMASFSFDVFTGDMVRALCSGGKLVLCPRELLLMPEQLYQLMQTEKVDCGEFVPVVMRNLIGHLEKTGQNLELLKVLVVGSDSWYVQEYQQLQKLCQQNTRIINSYGTSETTIDSCYFESSAINLASDVLVPIGRPLSNIKIYILDGNLGAIRC